MSSKSFVLTAFILCCSIAMSAQDTAFVNGVARFQKELNEFYSDAEKSPLSEEDRKKFKEHEFFELNEKFRVTADFQKIKKGKIVEMKTSTTRIASYREYGTATFKLDGQEYSLMFYQSTGKLPEKYKNHLFVPFTDKTNGFSSYGGGRYLDLYTTEIEGDKVVIDFNKCYNPYCAYSDKYSCPVPPRRNSLDVKIEAGIKLDH